MRHESSHEESNHRRHAESRIATAAGVTYSYDAQGRRVSKSNGKNYVYGLGGEILAETDGSGNTLNEYVFFGGKRVAMLPAGGSAEYYVEDLLGSSRVMTTNTGSVCYDADFDPYGGEHAYTNNCPSSNAYKFEGKERDTETGNDDFGARYYTSRFGRWLSADWSSTPVPVPYANLTNPQTLNLYAMVSDDPESFADLDGHCWPPSACADVIDSYVQVFRQDGLSVNDHTSPAVAFINTFANGVTADLASGAADVLRLGTGTAAAIDSAKQGDYAGAASNLAQDGGRVGAVILTVTGAAGKGGPAEVPRTDAPAANDLGRSATSTTSPSGKTTTTVTDPAGSTTYKTTPGKTGGESTTVIRKDADGNVKYVKQEARTNTRDNTKPPDHVHYKRPIDKEVKP